LRNDKYVLNHDNVIVIAARTAIRMQQRKKFAIVWSDRITHAIAHIRCYNIKLSQKAIMQTTYRTHMQSLGMAYVGVFVIYVGVICFSYNIRA